VIEAAVIGCGVQGQLHLGALGILDGVRVRAVCDVDTTALRAAQERFEVPHAYSTYERLFQREAIDLACICTMPNTHKAIALHAFAVGANVLCEKPFALNLAEAQEMASAARTAQRRLSVGFNMRYMHASQKAALAIARGDIGKPLYAHASLHCGVPSWGSHLVTAISGGGILAGSGVHMIDLVRWLCGQPSPVSATGFVCTRFPADEVAVAANPALVSTWDGENLVDGHIRFADGLHMSLRADARLNQRVVKYRFEIRGDEGRIEFDPFDDRPVGLLAPLASGTQPEEVDHGDLAVVDRALRLSVERQAEDVVRALREQHASLVGVDEALVVQSLVDALYESAETRREVLLDAPGGLCHADR
jgi:UDP-N-acetyl-2-amino-2-deoxyglucuronate dehydrogenase